MSTKKGKSTALATRKRTNLHEARKANLDDATFEGPSGRFWTQWIKPKNAALLSQTLGRCYFVMKNHGPNNVMLMAHQGDLMDLPSGAVRATYAHGTITVENRGKNSVLIEFEFLPIHGIK
jgi:hypothetical protein